MQDRDTLFEALGRSAEPRAVEALDTLIRDAPDGDLARINALDLATGKNLDECALIAPLLYATRFGLFESVVERRPSELPRRARRSKAPSVRSTTIRFATGAKRER